MNTRWVFPPLVACLLVGCEGKSPVEPIAYQTPVPAAALQGTILIQSTDGFIPYSTGSLTVEQWGISHSQRLSQDGSYTIHYILQPGKAFISVAAPTGYSPLLESVELFPGTNPFNRSIRKRA